MSMWGWILLASAVAWLTKLAGYLVPARWLQGPRMARVAALLTIGLLAALAASNAFASADGLALDARAGALLAAALALACRLPFIAVVVAGAAAAATLRALGLP